MGPGNLLIKTTLQGRRTRRRPPESASFRDINLTGSVAPCGLTRFRLLPTALQYGILPTGAALNKASPVRDRDGPALIDARKRLISRTTHASRPGDQALSRARAALFQHAPSPPGGRPPLPEPAAALNPLPGGFDILNELTSRP